MIKATFWTKAQSLVLFFFCTFVYCFECNFWHFKRDQSVCQASIKWSEASFSSIFRLKVKRSSPYNIIQCIKFTILFQTANFRFITEQRFPAGTKSWIFKNMHMITIYVLTNLYLKVFLPVQCLSTLLFCSMLSSVSNHLSQPQRPHQRAASARTSKNCWYML